MSQEYLRQLPGHQRFAPGERGLAWRLHIDGPLLAALLLLTALGLFVLYSASAESHAMMVRQGIRIGTGLVAMLIVAQIPPRTYRFWTPVIFVLGVFLLVLVLMAGTEAKGARRWLQIPGIGNFQPSELMKIAVPAMVAWYFRERPLPARTKDVAIAMAIIMLPTMLIARQPDLGTSLLVATAGVIVLFMAGLAWRLILAATALMAIAAPLMYYFVLHEYQRRRVDTFLNPEADPLGAGWNIIQSKTAIGSGGLSGKGWLNGTQSRLDFLPESSTDFILAVMGEEFGLLGILALLVIYLFIVSRGLAISWQAQVTYDRLLAAALAMTFFVYVFVNMGMVSGILPVVGVPLPLVSYGGTSIVTLMIGFGMLMSIHTHRRFM